MRLQAPLDAHGKPWPALCASVDRQPESESSLPGSTHSIFHPPIWRQGAGPSPALRLLGKCRKHTRAAARAAHCSADRGFPSGRLRAAQPHALQ
jgi:hypothetical protein